MFKRCVSIVHAVFKWILVIALTLSVAFCAATEWISRRTLASRRAEIAAKRTEVEPLRPIVEEVEAFQRQKDALQKRIDAINQLKQNQKGPAEAIAKLASVDATGIDSVAVTGKDLVINRR
jgi:Tfp pilus assembly protein PilN